MKICATYGLNSAQDELWIETKQILLIYWMNVYNGLLEIYPKAILRCKLYGYFTLLFNINGHDVVLSNCFIKCCLFNQRVHVMWDEESD